MRERHPHQGLSDASLELLKERAIDLAKIDEASATGYGAENDGKTYLVFRYLDERYGIPVSLVSEVVPLSKVLAIPGAPSHVVGLTRLRGKILALVNLRSFFRKNLSGYADADLAVVTEIEGRLFGIVCSKVESLVTVDVQDTEDVPDSFNERVRRTMVGFTDRDIMLLDAQRLIDEEGFVIR